MAGFALLALAGPAVAAPVPVPPVDVEADVQNLLDPIVLVDGAGNATAVWSANPAGAEPHSIRFARRAPGGPWSAPARLSELPGGDGADAIPEAVVMPSGDVVVQWTGFSGGSPVAVRMRTIAADGTLGPQTTLPDPPGVGDRLVASPRGDLALLWGEVAAEGPYLVARVWLAGEAGFGPKEPISAHPVNSEGVTDTVAAFDSQGRLIIVYVQKEAVVGGDAFQERVRIRRRATNGVLTGSTLSEVSNDSSEDAGAIDLAIDGQDVSHVLFTQRLTGPPRKSVRIRTVDAAMTPGPVVDVREDLPAAPAVETAVGVDSAGREAIAWTETLEMRELVRARVRPAGGVLGAIDTLSDVDRRAFLGPAVRRHGDNLAVAWRELGQPERLRVALLEAGASEFLPALTVGTVTGIGDLEDGLDFGFDAAGNLTLAAIERSGTTAQGIAAMLGDNDGPPDLSALSIPASGAPGASLPFSVGAADWSGTSAVSWLFSDGASASGSAVSHAFAGPGAASATVTATDLAGQSAVAGGLLSIAAPSPTPTPLTAPTPTPRPAGDSGPDSDIVGLARSVKRSKLKAIRGTASDDRGVARVEVAVVKLDGGARAAAKRCRVLTSSGRLRRRRAPRGRCTATGFLRATLSGGKTWRLLLRRPLPKGRYVVYSRAVDSVGQVERTFSAADRNRALITVR